jgi:hypothetical protein
VFGVIGQIEGLGLELLELRRIQVEPKLPEAADPGLRDDRTSPILHVGE